MADDQVAAHIEQIHLGEAVTTQHRAHAGAAKESIDDLVGILGDDAGLDTAHAIHETHEQT